MQSEVKHLRYQQELMMLNSILFPRGGGGQGVIGSPKQMNFP